MKLRRFLSCMMALLLVCSLPVSALAAEYDLAQGSIKVEADTSGQYVTQEAQGINRQEDANPVITQTTGTETKNTVTIEVEAGAEANVTIQDVNIVNSDPVDAPQNHSGEAAVTIDVAEGAEANVTLDGVNIDVSGTGKYGNTAYSGEAAVQITGNGNVTLELDGENTLQSGSNRAGVEKNDATGTGELTITDETGTSGSLEATGGIYGAGIGGGREGDGSNITITGSAEVTATGGDDGGSGIGGGYSGSGSDITIEGSAEVTAQGGVKGSGIGGGAYGSGSNITISGSAEVTAQGTDGGAGIGGGEGDTGSDITITGSAEVIAKGGNAGSGIGGGAVESGSNITISGDAQVKVQGGEAFQWGVWFYGKGAAIGDGGAAQKNAYPDPGAEVDPDICKLTPNGRIEYYAPGADMETDAPYKIVTGTYGLSQPAEPAQPLYRVIGQDGKAVACKEARTSGVLTITVEADFATLTGSISGMKTLKAQGVDTIVFVTNGATSTFALADLLAQDGDSYALTHDGETVTFTLGNGTDISKILK